MDKRYTYQEEIEQKRLWLERKIKRELKIVINAIIDKVIWKVLFSGKISSPSGSIFPEKTCIP